MFPMELSLWASVKKLEIGFILNVWSPQLAPHILLWMYTLLNHLNSNRVASMPPFNPLNNKDDSLLYNKLIYNNNKSGRSRQAILDSYIDTGRLALMRATMIMLWILNEAGAGRKFMTDIEKELAYNAKILHPFRECFYIKKYTYAEANIEMKNQAEKMGESVY
jgi:hypothetical protein